MASIDDQLKMVAQLFADQAKIPMTCNCGAPFKIQLIGLTEETDFSCPTCGATGRLSEEQIEDYREELVEMLHEQYDSVDRELPDDAALDFYFAHGRFPEHDEHMARTAYPVPLVGESFYQSAIAGCGEGEAVVLWHEPDNPFDERAIAAVCHGDTIGYVGRESWLTEALLDEEQGCTARIKRIAKSNGPDRGVVLEVVMGGDPIRERDYQGG